MPAAASTPLVTVELVAGSIWGGGLARTGAVARPATATLGPSARIDLFRALGRRYGIVGTTALLVAIVGGAILLSGHRWEWRLIATLVVTVGLLAASAIGMLQARRMTRLRRRALLEPGLDPRVRRGAIAASVLRGAIAAFTFALVVLAATLAS
jgi:hypothetical protein